MLLKNCTQYVSKFGKLSCGHRTGNLVFIPISKKGSSKERSNYVTVALILHASKVMLKILQGRLQQYMNGEYIMWNSSRVLGESRAGIKTAWRDINRYADDTTLMAESEKELKSLLMRVKEDSEKAGLNLNIQNTKIMASVPSLHGKEKGKKWKEWQILFSWAPKLLWMVTAAMKWKASCSLEEELVVVV